VSTKKLNLCVVFLAVTFCFSTNLMVPFIKFSRAETAGISLSGKAVQFLCRDYAKNGIINADVGVGAHALYVLTQAGVEVGTCLHEEVSLKDAVIAAAKDDIANADKVRAKCLAQDLVVMKALRQNDLAGRLLQILKSKQSNSGFEDTGVLSIYSNMPAFDLLSRAGLMSQINSDQAKGYILAKQYLKAEDARYGSWGALDNEEYYADFMATAEAVRVLYLLDPDKRDAQIQEAINHGLAWMKYQQKEDGSFMAGMDDPLIDTCEVIVTLKMLERDPGTWQSSEGKSAVDYIRSKALNPDGSFGMSKNAMGATWVLGACLALNEKIEVLPQATPGPQIQSGLQNIKDIQGHWAENTIYRLAQKGIVSGYPDGTFKPKDRVTHNELAAMMVRLLQAEPLQRMICISPLKSLKTPEIFPSGCWGP
jgi:hypothetical protein